MLPGFSQLDHCDGLKTNIKLSSYASLSARCLQKAFYFFNFLIRKLCIVMPFAQRSISIAKPAFAGGVFHVVRISAGKQMFRSYARRIVAVVTDAQSFWDWSFVNFIRNPVSKNLFSRSISATTNTKKAISFFVFMTSPKPTGFGLFNLSPKSLDGLI